MSGDTIAAAAADAVSQQQQQSDVDKPMWLTSWKDQLAGAAATSACMELSDLNGDANYKLVVAAAARRLKVFSGTSAVSDSPLLDVPVGVVSFYTDGNTTDLVRLPLLAVATGQYIFMYKSLRPYYKFVLPPVELSQEERNVWSTLKAAVPLAATASKTNNNNNEQQQQQRSQQLDDEQHIVPALAQLEQLKDKGTYLSARSTDLLAIESPSERIEFVERCRGTDLVQNTVVTCIAVLKREREDLDAPGQLVVGTESAKLLLLDKTGAQIQKRTSLPSVPVQLLTSGLADSDYRVVVLCRDGCVYITKNGEMAPGNRGLECDTMITCFTRMESTVVCGTMSKHLMHFSLRGLRVASLPMPSTVVALAPMMPDTARQSRSIVVGLANNEVRVYTGKTLINRMPVPQPVLGLRVGRYGTEDNCLCISFKSGVVTVLMLPRTAKLDPKSGAAVPSSSPPKEQDVPLQIPKRTNIYVENLQRERDGAVDMYRSFHRDVCKLRLMTTRAFARLLTDVKTGDVTESFASAVSLRMSCTVAGLGPSFRLRVSLQNTGVQSLTGLYLVVLQGIYSIDHPRSAVPALVPSVLYNFDLILEAPEGCNSSDSVRVMVCSGNGAAPVVSQALAMPVPEGLVAAQQE